MRAGTPCCGTSELTVTAPLRSDRCPGRSAIESPSRARMSCIASGMSHVSSTESPCCADVAIASSSRCTRWRRHAWSSSTSQNVSSISCNNSTHSATGRKCCTATCRSTRRASRSANVPTSSRSSEPRSSYGTTEPRTTRGVGADIAVPARSWSTMPRQVPVVIVSGRPHAVRCSGERPQ